MMVTNWQLLQDGESEDSSFTSSSISNFKSPSASLNEIEEYMCMLEGGADPDANQYIDAMSYQRLPRPSIGNLSLNTTTTKDHYLINNEEAHSYIITKDNCFFNALDTKSFQCPLDFDTNLSHSPIASSFLKGIKQAYAQSLHIIDNAQLPPKSDYSLLHIDASLAPSPPFPFVSEDSYSKHLLDKFEARQAGESLVNCLSPHCNEALETTSNGAYISYLPSTTTFTTSPTLPSIISTNSSPITSLASHTSAITDTASMDAASMPPDVCQANHFANGSSEMMPSLMSLHTKSFNRTSKSKNVEIDKMMKRKRKRTRSRKNSEELESQRMTHIAVERNRRRQMNQHLNDLRSLMPSSYIQRGDQASIVGGAIRLVEELEQMLESLLLQRKLRVEEPNEQVPLPHLDGDKSASITKESYACSSSSMVNVQVEMIPLSSILVKVIAPKKHHQLLHTLQALSFLSLKVLHLNITTLDISIIYNFNLKMEKDCQFQTPLQLAKSIQHVFESLKTKSQ